ncbi:MAG: DUF2283 domain-containing protein [Dehalococcoidia bacterium]|nr:DUF2283 domain-containing protein [Dehalococcoidia bacterium]MSQ36566.1 DUF2283 domain-containing protein [Dehalococcoidia bacterium]
MVQYDHEADVLYVMLEFPEGKQYGAQLDEYRIVHSDEGGRVVAVEFLGVSRGLNLSDVPEAPRIVEELQRFRAATQGLQVSTATSS